MSHRLGVSLEKEWRWALVDARGGRCRVVRIGVAPAGDWDAVAKAAGAAASVGIALPDSDVLVRRVRIGHPPASVPALRQLVRWRLKDDLPFASPAIDARLEDEHAIVLAADRLRVQSVEDAASRCGPVERITSVGLASLGALGVPRTGTSIVHDGSSFAIVRSKNGSLAAIQLLDAAPPDEAAEWVDRRKVLPPSDLVWGSVPEDSRGAFLPAVGAALDGLRLNVATNPPVPRPARVLAWSAAAIAILFAIGAVVMTLQASVELREEREALAALAPPIEKTSPPPPEIDALRKVLGRRPNWTAFLASLERGLPPSVALDHLDWSAGVYEVRVIGEEADVEASRSTLARLGTTSTKSQSGSAAAARATFAIQPSDAEGLP